MTGKEAKQQSKKVRMLVSRGVPTGGGAIIRAGAEVKLPAHLADAYVADGTAQFVEESQLPKSDKTKTEVQADAKGKS